MLASIRGSSVKKIGFLSFGHWTDSPGSQVRSAADSLLQSIELAVAAQEWGADAHTSECTISLPIELALPVAGARQRTRGG